jgi:hypothetical protein
MILEMSKDRPGFKRELIAREQCYKTFKGVFLVFGIIGQFEQTSSIFTDKFELSFACKTSNASSLTCKACIKTRHLDT